MDTDSPLTLPSCGRRIIPRIVQSLHYLRISGIVANVNTDKFYETLNINTEASLFLRPSMPGYERPCYEVKSPTQLSELIISITRVAAEQAAELLHASLSQTSQQGRNNRTHGGAPIVVKNVFHPAKTDSPEVHALCVSSKDRHNPVAKIVVVCLPPWRYGTLDLKDFVSRTSLRHEPASRTKPDSPPPTTADVIWALTYDACIAADCSYFVVSNYEGWVLGNHRTHIEKRWEVSPIMRFNNEEPSIPKILVQHFKQALSPIIDQKVITLKDSSTTSLPADEESDEDEYPLQFRDVANLEGFQARFLALLDCQK